MYRLFYVLCSIIILVFTIVIWAFTDTSAFFQEGLVFGFFLSPLAGVASATLCLLGRKRLFKGVGTWTVVITYLLSITLSPYLVDSLGVKIARYSQVLASSVHDKEFDKERVSDLTRIRRETGLNVVDYIEKNNPSGRVIIAEVSSNLGKDTYVLLLKDGRIIDKIILRDLIVKKIEKKQSPDSLVIRTHYRYTVQNNIPDYNKIELVSNITFDNRKALQMIHVVNVTESSSKIKIDYLKKQELQP